MASVYLSFLQSPSTSHLASDASLNYITTTTDINEPTTILKHLQSQAKQVTKKGEKVLNAVEGSNSLVLETETTLQFNNGGGAYLPSMDENVLDEKLVTFPLLHVVSFDGEQKIKQIRLYWDQGTLLKQVEAIGRTGRNWPIKDGKSQIESIIKSLKSSGMDPNEKTPLSPRNPNEVVISPHKRGESKSAMRDPHASLNLFAGRDVNADAAAPYEGPKLAPRASAKPAPREYGELFAGGDSTSAASKVRSPSPTKMDGLVVKSGAGKHHVANRLFDENDPASTTRSPERKKTYDQKYQHFSFGDGEDAPQGKRPSSGRGAKAQSHFSFEDFSTPAKHKSKPRRDDEVHWGGEDPPSPPVRPIVHAPRKDAESHFELTDDSTSAAGKADSLNPATQVDNTRRGNDFGAHYSMTDVPAPSTESESARPTSRGGRSDMEQHWSMGTPPVERKVYKTAGDGMGSRKGADAGEQKLNRYRTAGDGMGGKKSTGGKSWWDYEDLEEAEVRPTARGQRI